MSGEPKKRILITGLSGYIGKHLVSSFHPAYSIFGLSRDVPKAGLKLRERQLSANVETIFSWNQLPAIPEVDAVIHLAGLAHDVKDKTPESVYLEANVEFTKKIFKWFLESGASHFIYFSSVKAVADALDADKILTESTPAHPQTPYGRSKRAAEQYILSAMDVYQRSGSVHGDKNVAILRPALVVGPDHKGNLDLILKYANSGLPWPLGSFDNERSMASVGNIVYVIERLIQMQAVFGIFNLADDGYISTNELYALLCQGSGRKPVIWRLPKMLIRLAAFIGDYTGLPLNTSRLKKITGSFKVSNALIKTSLNVDQLAVSTRESIRASINP